MEFKRKAYQKLLEWKTRPNHKPLIVEGLRQVGKSYLVSAFAKENYENAVVFDFRYDPKTRKFFQGDLIFIKAKECNTPGANLIYLMSLKLRLIRLDRHN